MNKINADDSCVVVIDIQQKLAKIVKDDNILKNSRIIAKSADLLNIPVIVSEQYPSGLGKTIDSVSEVLHNAFYIEKTDFSLFSDIAFQNHLKSINKKQVILFGIETHICVLQTAFDLLTAGYEVFIVEDASDSRKESNKNAALIRLSHAGAQIVTTEMVVFEWLKNSKHHNFKEIQALIK